MSRTTIARTAGGLAAALLVGGLSGPATAGSADRRPHTVHVALVSAAGSGCPDTSAAEVVAHDDGNGFHARYPRFQAVAPPFSNRFCLVVLKVTVPQGYRVGIRRVAYRGAARVAHGARVSFDAKYAWAGGETMHHPGYRQSGPFRGNWNQEHRLDDAHWSACTPESQFQVTQTLRAHSNPPANTADSRVSLETPGEDWALYCEWEMAPCGGTAPRRA
ncbi:hypothetical protein GCM10010124_19110 [Pilimelia terevasa]|uniref:Secreted protein n=1 Tax=Pilimelia terevasa TaxID=53372 RepID=A0A8J3FIU4_9ACTN|nr:DUF4360 domain-containing protein [Pilimelia terevasa]GGK26621.1 hypothetical protein GCM10010124_19110 [Pilimelia terevasa]